MILVGGCIMFGDDGGLAVRVARRIDRRVARVAGIFCFTPRPRCSATAAVKKPGLRGHALAFLTPPPNATAGIKKTASFTIVEKRFAAENRRRWFRGNRPASERREILPARERRQ